MFDLTLVFTAFLLSITLAAFFLYYKRLKSAQVEYEKAKDIIGDIVISVNKDLQRQGEKTTSISGKVDAIAYENQRVSNK